MVLNDNVSSGLSTMLGPWGTTPGFCYGTQPHGFPFCQSLLLISCFQFTLCPSVKWFIPPQMWHSWFFLPASFFFNACLTHKPLFTSPYTTSLSLPLPDVSGWITFVTSQNQPWAQQKCRSGQRASHDHSRPLMPPTGGGLSRQALGLCGVIWLASLRILKLKSFCFPHPPTHTMWDFISFSCISQRSMWEGTVEKVTYHVRARDCKMQKMRASPLLYHWKKNDTVTGTCVTRGTHRKG